MISKKNRRPKNRKKSGKSKKIRNITRNNKNLRIKRKSNKKLNVRRNKRRKSQRGGMNQSMPEASYNVAATSGFGAPGQALNTSGFGKPGKSNISPFSKVIETGRKHVNNNYNFNAKRIAKRAQTRDLQITDANFGMFPKDIETARSIKDCQMKFNGYPQTVLAATAKTGKERTVEIVKILGPTLPATAAVQSTDKEVLSEIKRKNVSQEVLINFSKSIEKEGGQSEAEIILCLEGDTKEKHFKTVKDMLDADMKFIRLYQFMMLPGTQSTTNESRRKWQYTCKYRVLPRCFGTYRFRDQKFPVAEIEEICIANKTMPYEDYQDCRKFDLTVEIFNNDSILADLMSFLRMNNIKDELEAYYIPCKRKKYMTDITIPKTITILRQFLRPVKKTLLS